MTEPVSREIINAYVDGELDAEEREHLESRMAEDGALRAEVCAQRTLKEQVKFAYSDPPHGRAATPVRQSGRGWHQALAAGLLLAVGLGGGWLAHDRFAPPASFDRLAGLPAGYQPVALSGQVDVRHVVLHLDSGDPARTAATLNLAERLARTDRAARVELVANSFGIDLLRQDRSPELAHVEELARRYPNLLLVACGQTLARLLREGQPVHLVPEAKVASSAINEIMARLRQGWVYVKM
jgi:intracellular sulfur oxidation DsrE/DsrF family protein